MIPISLRLKLVKAIVAIAFLAGFLLSPALWRNSGRSFPIIKPLESIPVVPAPFDAVLLILFLALCFLWAFYPKRIIGAVAVSGLSVVLLQDQMRWQPWVYIYLLLLLPFLFRADKNREDTAALHYLQWIMAGVYLWSGLQKLNINFVAGPFIQMLKEFGVPETSVPAVKKLGYIIPLIEMSMGVALLIPRARKAGTGVAIGMHLFILFYLSQVAAVRNSIVYPWNAAMILLVVTLFWGVQQKSLFPLQDMKANPGRAIPLVLVWIFPLLNLAGFWDHYLSFSFYSNKPCQYYIAVKDEALSKVDPALKPYFVKIKGLEGGQVIEVNRWTLGVLNVPFYPEKRLFKKLGRSFCQLDIPEDHLFFLELSYTHGEQEFKPFTCGELEK